MWPNNNNVTNVIVCITGPRGYYRREDLAGSTTSFAESTTSNFPPYNNRSGASFDSRAGSLQDGNAGSLQDRRSGSLTAGPSSWDVADQDIIRNRSPSPYQLTQPTLAHT